MNKRSVQQPEYVCILDSSHLATFCFDDSFAHLLHSVMQLHKILIWNGFLAVLKDFLDVFSTCCLPFLLSAVRLITNCFYHSIILLLHQIALTQPLNSLDMFWGLFLVPLSTNEMGWHVTAVAAMLVKWA